MIFVSRKQKMFPQQNNVSFARKQGNMFPQQCFRNNVSSFAEALSDHVRLAGRLRKVNCLNGVVAFTVNG